MSSAQPALQPKAALGPIPDVPVHAPERSDTVLASDNPVPVHHLSHYQEGYDYRPDLYAYTETYTTDPCYVVEDVRIVASQDHQTAVHQINQCLDRLVAVRHWLLHISRDVHITHIAEGLRRFVQLLDLEVPPTNRLGPDLAVWRGPDPRVLAYDFRTVEAPPLLVVEVVSLTSGDNDRRRKRRTYAQMQIPEYWLLDETGATTSFQIYTRPTPQGAPSAYTRQATAPDGGIFSPVWGETVRWHAAARVLQRWDDSRGTWVNIYVSRAENHAEGRAEGMAIGEVRERITVIFEALAFSGVVLAPADRAAYQAQLAALPLDRLPGMTETLDVLAAVPAGAERTSAALAFLDERITPAPE